MAAQPTGVMADTAASSLLMLSSLSSSLSAAHSASQLIASRNMLAEPLPAVTGLIHKKDKPKTYHKVAKDFRCQWCGTSNTPEMRPGPAGKNTLCNRCGLRYRRAKRAAERATVPPQPVDRMSIKFLTS